MLQAICCATVSETSERICRSLEQTSESYKRALRLKRAYWSTMKQECLLARIACSGTQPPTHLREKIQRARGAIAPRVSNAIGTKRKLWGGKNTWPPSERRQVLRHQQQNDLRHAGKTEQAYWALWCPMSRACLLAKGVNRITYWSQGVASLHHPSPPLDNIRVMVIVWRVKGNIISSSFGPTTMTWWLT